MAQNYHSHQHLECFLLHVNPETVLTQFAHQFKNARQLLMVGHCQAKTGQW